MNSQLVRWGILGCGDVTERKSGPAFQKANGSALVAVMRRRGELARDYAQRHHVPRWYDRAEDLIADPDVDAVYIATPPAFHAPYAMACARAGKPAYVEKPMALIHGECVAMVQAFEQAHLPLFVAYYRRALPRFVRIAELIRSSVIGTPRIVQITLLKPPDPARESGADLPWRLLPELSGGGRFVDLACHTLDFLDFALGPISNAQGLAVNQGHLYPAEDAVAATLQFASGVVGSGLWAFTTHERRDEVRIVGTSGTVSFSTFGNEPIRVESHGQVHEEHIAHPEHIQQPLIQLIVDELLGRGTCPSTGQSAARTTAVIDQVLEGYRARSKKLPART